MRVLVKEPGNCYPAGRSLREYVQTLDRAPRHASPDGAVHSRLPQPDRPTRTTDWNLSRLGLGRHPSEPRSKRCPATAHLLRNVDSPGAFLWGAGRSLRYRPYLSHYPHYHRGLCG